MEGRTTDRTPLPSPHRHATAWCGRYTHGGFEPGTVAAAHEAGATHTPCPDAEPAAQRCPASPPSPSLSDLCLELLASPPSPPPEGMQGCLLTLDLEAGAWGSWQPGATLGPADLALGRPGQHRQDTPLSPFSSSLRGLPTLCPGEMGGSLCFWVPGVDETRAPQRGWGHSTSSVSLLSSAGQQHTGGRILWRWGGPCVHQKVVVA